MPPSVLRRALAAGALLLLVRPALAADDPVAIRGAEGARRRQPGPGAAVPRPHGGARPRSMNGWPRRDRQILHQPQRRRGVHQVRRTALWHSVAAGVSRHARALQARRDRPRAGLARRRPALLPDQQDGRQPRRMQRARRLATDHGDDPRFIDTVVFDGQADARRLHRGADAAAAADHQGGADRPRPSARLSTTRRRISSSIWQDKDGVHTVWESARAAADAGGRLPERAGAPSARRSSSNLDAVCDDEGKSACARGRHRRSHRAPTTADYAVHREPPMASSPSRRPTRARRRRRRARGACSPACMTRARAHPSRARHCRGSRATSLALSDALEALIASGTRHARPTATYAYAGGARASTPTPPRGVRARRHHRPRGAGEGAARRQPGAPTSNATPGAAASSTRISATARRRAARHALRHRAGDAAEARRFRDRSRAARGSSPPRIRSAARTTCASPKPT